jgi:hypothetical protein
MGSSSCRAAALAYYDNVLMSSSDEDLNGETDLLMVVVGIVNEHFLMPPRRAAHLKSGRPTSITIEKLATRAYTRTTSTRSIRSIKRRHFVAGIEYPENVSDHS